MDTSNMPLLKQKFFEYFRLSLIGNEHIIEAMFFAFCSSAFQIKYLFGGKYIRARICTFHIQESGSGKSVAMSILENLFKSIMPVSKIQRLLKVTDASLIGGYVDNNIKKSKQKPQSRLLFTKEVLIWDEGTRLFKQDNHTKDLQHILQTATDEPGRVAIALKDQIIDEYTHTVIVAGSYFDKMIKKQILDTGFFQRMFVTYKEFSEFEKEEIELKWSEMCKKEATEKQKKLAFEILQLLKNEYNYGHEDDNIFCFWKKWEHYSIIEIPETLLSEFSLVQNEYRKKNIVMQYEDGRQETLSSIWNRCRTMILRIAVQNAFLNKRYTIIEEDLRHGLQYVSEYHIDGMKSILNMMNDKPEQMKKIKRTEETKKILFYLRTLIKINKGKPVTQSQLIQFIQKQKNSSEVQDNIIRQGINATLKNINCLGKKGEIIISKDGNRKLLSL